MAQTGSRRAFRGKVVAEREGRHRHKSMQLLSDMSLFETAGVSISTSPELRRKNDEKKQSQVALVRPTCIHNDLSFFSERLIFCMGGDLMVCFSQALLALLL